MRSGLPEGGALPAAITSSLLDTLNYSSFLSRWPVVGRIGVGVSSGTCPSRRAMGWGQCRWPFIRGCFETLPQLLALCVVDGGAAQLRVERACLELTKRQ